MKVRTTISIDVVYDNEELTEDGNNAVTEGGLLEYFIEERMVAFLDYPETFEIVNTHIHTNSVEQL